MEMINRTFSKIEFDECFQWINYNESMNGLLENSLTSIVFNILILYVDFVTVALADGE